MRISFFIANYISGDFESAGKKLSTLAVFGTSVTLTANETAAILKTAVHIFAR